MAAVVLCSYSHIFCRCFAHIVNLACKAVIAAITNIDYAAADAATYEPPTSTSSATTFLASLAIRASSERRQEFSRIVKRLRAGKDLKLLRDMDVRWSSTLLMIERALDLQEPIEQFLKARLPDRQLAPEEWSALSVVQKILAVPHAFQQKLSQEKTPTLNGTIPVFDAMSNSWERLKGDKDLPVDAVDVVEAGLSKLRDYRARITRVPVYYLAIRTLFVILSRTHQLMTVCSFRSEEEDTMVLQERPRRGRRRQGALLQSCKALTFIRSGYLLTNL
ncbi:hypothetical protein EV121DRAFT_218164 [Schizophyllum commune]